MVAASSATSAESAVAPEHSSRSPAPRPGLAFIAVVTVVWVVAGGLSCAGGRSPGWIALITLSALGVISFSLKEPDVGSRISFSFLSIVLLASASILGPFGAWIVGSVAVLVARDKMRWDQRLFNVAMMSLIGTAGAWAYVLAHGASNLEHLRDPGALVVGVGLPLIVADVVQCLVNAVLLSGVMHFFSGAPFAVLVRQILTTSGVAYVGYGVIGFLFVILWIPADLGPFSVVLVIVPLLAARWAFIQYGEERRSHERTIDTLVTALARKDPEAAARSRAAAQMAEWIAEELALAPSQISAARYAGTLHEIGRIGVPTRVLRLSADALDDDQRRSLRQHGVIGARMIEDIDFLEEARSGIRHQGEHFDGTGGPDGLIGRDIPASARIVAVASRFAEVTEQREHYPGRSATEALRLLDRDIGHYDPVVLEATRAVLDRHGWSVSTWSAG